MRYSSGSLLLCLVMFVCYIALQVSPLLRPAVEGAPAGTVSHANDYKHIWLGSFMLGEGLSPYNDQQFFQLMSEQAQRDPRFGSINPYVYLPFTGFVLRPLSMMDFAPSVVAFQIVNHLCLLGGVVLLLWGLGKLDWWWLAVAIAFLAFNNAVFRQNNAGQLNAVLFGGMCLLFAGLAKKWPPWIVGFIAGFLMLFKLSPGIFLIWFLIRREWRHGAWMMGWALLLSLLTCVLYSFQTHLDFLPVLQNMGYGKSTWAEYGATFWRDPYNLSFNSLFHRLFVEQKGSPIGAWLSLSPALANAMTWFVSLLMLVGFGFLANRDRGFEERLPFSFALAVLTSLLLPSILWDHYLTQAVIPAIVLVAAGRGWSRVAAVVAVLLMSIPMALGKPFYQEGVGLLMMNFKLIVPLVLAGFCVVELLRMDHRNAGAGEGDSSD